MTTYSEFLNLEFNGFEFEYHGYMPFSDYTNTGNIKTSLDNLYLVLLW